MRTDFTAVDTPFISIVIPTYNRPHCLRHCLQSIAQIRYPSDRFEAIVVDDGSTVPLETVTAEFQSQLPLTVVYQTNAGPATARNTGSRIAKGDYIAFTDDDCTPTPDWLAAFARQFARSPNSLLGGQTLNMLPHNLYAVAHQEMMDYFYRYYNAHPKSARFFASNNLALPARLFFDLGGFDSSFPLAAGEDRELCDRWLHQGYVLDYVPDARVHHAHPMTLRSFWRQHFRYGQGAFHFRRICAQRRAGKMTVESLSFYLDLLLYPLKQCPLGTKVQLTLLFFCSQVANTLGFFWQGFRDEKGFQ
ncbi:glycosyltransferase [Altericista sp. CCNU0014]|uniref:glycosyltransferase n=1 Tax=Altericista sp. CCNU0014 TaxID=3082949 RepID=UPI00384C3ADF